MSDSKRYVSVGADGWPTAFYHGEYVADQPPGSIEISIEDYEDCIAHQGQRKFLDGQAVVVPFPTPKPVWPRAQRDKLLAASDWTQIPDAPLSIESKIAWREYRDQLRQLPNTQPDPTNVSWPEPPA